jgi:hypothetical protein
MAAADGVHTSIAMRQQNNWTAAYILFAYILPPFLFLMPFRIHTVSTFGIDFPNSTFASNLTEFCSKF